MSSSTFSSRHLVAPIVLASLALASCNSNQPAETADATTAPATTTMPTAGSGVAAIKPTGPAPEWAPNMAPEMLAVIEKLDSLSGPTPPHKLTPAEVRKAPSFREAMMAVMQKYNIPAPHTTIDTMSQMVSPGLKVRIYTPQGATGPLPVIVYYHGGGWVIANLDTYDASQRALAAKTNAILVGVAYRQGPENKFPAAHDDSFAAYQWVLKNAGSFKGDPKRVAVAGESAGGGLAAAVSIMARDKGVQAPKHQLLVYPIAGYDMNTPSYQQHTKSKPLYKDFMAWFFKNYLRTPADGKNPMIDLVNAPNLKNLPPATVISAGIDPLMSEGKTYADKLQAAGVPVTYKLYPDVAHEFFGMGAVVPQAEEAENLAANELKNALK
ncbi:alpha/beta hydrolase [Hymenobacter sp. ISL-91]|uniref:alpha/beta hydrolase n=1 Tax=Hymenobacter sp. ISL-91 TaxID=2819151 RepID=UPI001BEA5ED2|nr:alpha/beta hydrolase [Hymenobacter sp. ISL-91]MBT2556548.1 alpha/beta hydrolase [Hymenobacter sp. ISL-91]